LPRQKEQGKTLKEMYKKWPYFNTNLDLVDMILAKAEVDIAENYDRLLVSDPDQAKLGARLREQLKQTTKAVGPQNKIVMNWHDREGQRGQIFSQTYR
jgi:phosphoenolpyruvate carboxylase